MFFLRGCGETVNFMRVFISYSRRNSSIARQIHQCLVRAGCDTFLDQQHMQVSEEWRQRIHAEIAAADSFVYLWSPAAQRSDMVQEEYDLARTRLPPERVQIVRVSGQEPDMPADVRKIEHVNLTREFWSVLPRLLNAVNVDLPATPETPAALTRGGLTLKEAVNRMPDVDAKTWHMNGREFRRLLLDVNAHATAWLITESEATLSVPPHDVQILLQFTGNRDTAEQVLEYLTATGQTPYIVLIQGPQHDGRFALPTDQSELHVWRECMLFVERCIEQWAPGRHRHFFFDAPQALVFPVGARLHVQMSFSMYTLNNRSDTPASRYVKVFTEA